jgi:hypothetical protein
MSFESVNEIRSKSGIKIFTRTELDKSLWSNYTEEIKTNLDINTVISFIKNQFNSVVAEKKSEINSPEFIKYFKDNPTHYSTLNISMVNIHTDEFYFTASLNIDSEAHTDEPFESETMIQYRLYNYSEDEIIKFLSNIRDIKFVYDTRGK